MLPLVTRAHPTCFDDYLEQTHLLGASQPFRRLLDADTFSAIILWGPPGCGKTVLAKLILQESKAIAVETSAASSGVAELRKIFNTARKALAKGQQTLLFIDEIHRFSKSQQDVLLPEIDQGVVRLVCATTENPSFALNAALISRAQVFQLKALSTESIHQRLIRLNTQQLLTSELLLAIAQKSNGDLRRAISYFDNISQLVTSEMTDAEKHEIAQTFFKSQAVSFNHSGADFYEVLSALIKSIRGSDPDASSYWLAVLLHVGTPLTTITRRLMISAAEEIGTADPTAFLLAQSTHQAVQVVGLPEASILLSECVVYLACAPKSPAAYLAQKTARNYVKEHGCTKVPEHLKTPASKTGKSEFFSDQYSWSHDTEQWTSTQAYTSASILHEHFYTPREIGAEAGLAAQINAQKRLQLEAVPSLAEDTEKSLTSQKLTASQQSTSASTTLAPAKQSKVKKAPRKRL